MKETYDFSSAKRGAVAPTKGKTRITIMLDDVVLEAARRRADKEGMGYQTLINSLLKEALCPPDSNPQHAALSEILQALHSLAKGQEVLEAKMDSSFGPVTPTLRYQREPSVPLQAREERAVMKTTKKRDPK